MQIDDLMGIKSGLSLFFRLTLKRGSTPTWRKNPERGSSRITRLGKVFVYVGPGNTRLLVGKVIMILEMTHEVKREQLAIIWNPTLMSLSGHRHKLCKVSVRADLLDSSKVSKARQRRLVQNRSGSICSGTPPYIQEDAMRSTVIIGVVPKDST